MKEILGNEDNVIIIRDGSNIKKERHNILSSATNNNDTTVVCCHIVNPNEDVQSYGQAMIMSKETEDGTTGNLYHVYLTSLHNRAILPEALKLSLREVITWFNKNKIKVDILYVTDSSISLSNLEFLNLRLIFQNIIKEVQRKSSSWNKSSLWIEKVEQTNHSLFMDFSNSKKEKSKKKDKDKKKKKSNKKKK